MSYCVQCGHIFTPDKNGISNPYHCLKCKPIKIEKICYFCRKEIKENEKYSEEKTDKSAYPWSQILSTHSIWKPVTYSGASSGIFSSYPTRTHYIHIKCKYRQIVQNNKTTINTLKSHIKDAEITQKDFQAKIISSQNETDKELEQLRREYPEETKIAQQEEVEEQI